MSKPKYTDTPFRVERWIYELRDKYRYLLAIYVPSSRANGLDTIELRYLRSNRTKLSASLLGFARSYSYPPSSYLSALLCIFSGY